MFKQVVVSLLTISTLLAVLFPFMPYLEYVMHYDHIVEHHCVNRDNAEMDCNGACYLKKQVEKSSDAEHNPLHKSNQSDTLQILPVIGIFDSVEYMSFPPHHLSSFILFSLNTYRNPFLQALYRPPQV